MSLSLNDIKTGVVKKPVRGLIYGTPGIGKSTFGANCPSPIFITTEDGLGLLDVPHLPTPETIKDFKEQVLLLLNEKHDYKTLVIDTADNLDLNIVQPAVFSEFSDSTRSFADIPWGKGPKRAAEYFAGIVKLLDRIRNEKDMHVFFLSHSLIRRHEPAGQEGYDRYEPDMNKHTRDVLVDWADIVGFASYEVHLKKVDSKFSERKVGVGTGARMLYLEERPHHMAKNRYTMPYEIPFEAQAFWQELKGKVSGKGKVVEKSKAVTNKTTDNKDKKND